jgi:Na+-driven multidrug efflux pump
MATSSVVQVVVTVLATAAVLGLISRVLRRATPSMFNDTTGAIEPEKSTAWFTIIGGCVMAIGGLYGALFRGAGSGGGPLTALGLCIAGFMLPSLTSAHKVTWKTRSKALRTCLVPGWDFEGPKATSQEPENDYRLLVRGAPGW